MVLTVCFDALGTCFTLEPAVKALEEVMEDTLPPGVARMVIMDWVCRPSLFRLSSHSALQTRYGSRYHMLRSVSRRSEGLHCESDSYLSKWGRLRIVRIHHLASSSAHRYHPQIYSTPINHLCPPTHTIPHVDHRARPFARLRPVDQFNPFPHIKGRLDTAQTRFSGCIGHYQRSENDD